MRLFLWQSLRAALRPTSAILTQKIRAIRQLEILRERLAQPPHLFEDLSLGWHRMPPPVLQGFLDKLPPQLFSGIVLPQDSHGFFPVWSSPSFGSIPHSSAGFTIPRPVSRRPGRGDRRAAYCRQATSEPQKPQ